MFYTNGGLAQLKGIGSIGSASARLTFKNNEEMVAFFRQDQIKKFQPKYGFSKN